MDYRNVTVGSDSNYILYGHNMKDGTMFGSIVKYKEQSHFDSHPIMYYLTPDKAYKIELLAGYVTPRNSEVYNKSFGTQEQLDKFMESAIKKIHIQLKCGICDGRQVDYLIYLLV